MTYRRAAAGVFLVGLLFLASMLHATGGRSSLPLDDSFIYFQYARQAAAGHPFVYVPGDPPGTGATSVPWMLVLSGGALLGFDGKAMIFLSMILGGLLLAAAVRWAGETEAALRPGVEDAGAPAVAAGFPLAAALVLLSGPLQWGAWSGMEIAYVAAAVAWTLLELARGDGRPGRRAAIAAAVLATSRPEGAALALLVAVAWAVRAALDHDARRGLAWALLPAALAFAQPLLNLAVGGDVRSAGFVAKSLLAAPGADPVDVLRGAALRAASLAAVLFGGAVPLADGRGLYAYDSEAAALWTAPGAGALFLIGVLPSAVREWRGRRPGPALVSIAWIATLLVGTCTLEEPDAHFSRYQMPALPVFLVWAAVGTARLARAVRESGGGLARLATGLRGWLLLCGAASVAFFAAAFGDNCGDIDRMQIRLGESLGATLPPGSIVAINDAGAIPYFSGLRTLDLVGLTSPAMAGLWPQGSGALWEAMESMPPPERPGWFCFFPNWFGFDGAGFLQRVGSVRLLTPSIVDAEKVLAAADWSLAGAGDVPRAVGAGARVVDRLDVADVRSERAHAFAGNDGEPGASAGTFLRRAAFAPGDEAIDGGRTLLREARFALARDPAATATVIVRTPGGVHIRALVSVDGGPWERVEIRGAAGRFHEQAVARIAPGEGRAEIRLRVTDEAAASAPLVLTHVFAVVEADG